MLSRQPDHGSPPVIAPGTSVETPETPSTKSRVSVTAIASNNSSGLQKRHSVPAGITKQAESPIGTSFLKRKRSHLEDSSLFSPSQKFASDENHPADKRQPRDIASTPDGSPTLNIKQLPPSEHLQADDGEAHALHIPTAEDEDAADLGQPPSESLSEPDCTLVDKQIDNSEDEDLSINVDVPGPAGRRGTQYETAVADQMGSPSDDDDTSKSQYISAPEQITPRGPRPVVFSDQHQRTLRRAQSVEASTSIKSTSPRILPAQNTASDTQDIFAPETRNLNPLLVVPEPYQGWPDLLPSDTSMQSPGEQTTDLTLESSSPVQPSNPNPSRKDMGSEEESRDPGSDIDAWIADRVSEGFSEDLVEAVFSSTNMDTELAIRALRHIRDQRKKSSGGSNVTELTANDIALMPQDWEGVWTGEDDRDMASTDARHVHRLVRKHGDEGFNARWEFLRIMKADE